MHKKSKPWGQYNLAKLFVNMNSIKAKQTEEWSKFYIIIIHGHYLKNQLVFIHVLHLLSINVF